MDALIRSRASQELNDQILRCLSVASCVVFHLVLRSAGNPLGQVWDWPFLVRFLATQKMNVRIAVKINLSPFSVHNDSLASNDLGKGRRAFAASQRRLRFLCPE